MRPCVDGRRARLGRVRWVLLGCAYLALNTVGATTVAPTSAAEARAVLDDGVLPRSIVERADKDPANAGTVPALQERDALAAGEAAVGRRVPDMAMLDRQGRTVRLSAYRGKPLLVSFIYTGCFQICPTQTRALHEAVQGLSKLLGPSQFNVVSIGFNQPFDSHDAMRDFAARQRIDYPNWEFLSPPREAVEPLTRAFGFSYVATPAGFDHVLGVTVVDGEGRIHAQVYGDRLRADQLGQPLRRLLLDAPAPPSASAIGAAIERIRILCTVYDPETGEYRYDYKLILSFIGGSLFFLTAFIYLVIAVREQRRERARSCPPRVSGSAA
jgi:protein SCO1/2